MRKRKESRHVRLYHYMLASAAWKSLDAVARNLYVEMLAKYGGPGTNNGRLIFSCRMAAEALGISKDKASDCFKKLTGCGFIMPMEKGGFNRKGNSARQATTWLITECASDVTGKLATKDFMRWSPDQGAVSASEKNRVRRADPLVGHADPPVRHTDRQGIKPYQRSATRTEIAGNSPSPVRQTDTASLPGGHAPPASASEPAAAAPQPVMVSPPPPPPGNPERGRMEVEAFPSVPQPASTATDRRARNPWAPDTSTGHLQIRRGFYRYGRQHEPFR